MRWRDENGQAMVEFALVVVLFLTLLSGLVDFGRIINSYFVMANASREGARVGILGRDDAEIAATVTSVSGSLDTSKVAVTVVPEEAARDRGTPLQVQVSYSVDLLMPFTAAVLPNPFPIEAATTMRME